MPTPSKKKRNGDAIERAYTAILMAGGYAEVLARQNPGFETIRNNTALKQPYGDSHVWSGFETIRNNTALKLISRGT